MKKSSIVLLLGASLISLNSFATDGGKCKKGDKHCTKNEKSCCKKSNSRAALLKVKPAVKKA